MGFNITTDDTKARSNWKIYLFSKKNIWEASGVMVNLDMYMSNNQGSQTGCYILVIVDLPAIKQH